jgi:hypothetical protein
MPGGIQAQRLVFTTGITDAAGLDAAWFAVCWA